MAQATLFWADQISGITGFWLGASARIGDNGEGAVPREVLLMSSAGVVDSAYSLWDGDTSDGIDSGSRSFEFSAGGGVASFSVQDADDTVSYAASAPGDITRVLVRAAVTQQALVELTQLSFSFYDGGTLVDSYTHSGSLSVDTRGEPVNYEAEHMLEVQPQAGVDAVVVSGLMRFITGEDIAARDSVRADLYVFTAA
jgi:hypothetical protein